MENKILRSHKVRIYPTNEQKELLEKSFNVARYAWNLSLQEWNGMYSTYKTSGRKEDKPSAYTIRNRFVKLIKPLKPWLSEVSKESYANSILDLGDAWTKYFKGQSKGMPKFKSKKKSRLSYTMVSNGNPTYFGWDQNKLHMPKFKKNNFIKTAECPRFNGKIKRVTISRIAGNYYASVLFECKSIPMQYKRHQNKTSMVGIDLGVKTLATFSDGTVSTKSCTKKIDKKIKKLQKKLSRKQKGSNNRMKAITKLQKAYLTKSNVLSDNLHKTTNYIVRHYNNVCLEDLSASNMVKNHKLARSVSDAQFYEFRRQIEYKIKYQLERGVSVGLTYADRFYPSSKLCSCCGFKKDTLSLSERIFICDNCGESIDRDLNAAINLERLIVIN